MLDKEEIDKILSCDNCPTSYACEGCDITYNDKQKIKEYINWIEKSNEQLDRENNRLEKIEFERDMANETIEEMAYYISNLDIEEDICSEVKEKPCGDETSVPVEYCVECIKQYFKKKVDEKYK